MKIINSYQTFNEGKFQNLSNKYMDYYYFEIDTSLTSVREKFNLIEDNAYRAFATFIENIEHYDELDCLKIGLMNYPPERFTKKVFRTKFNEAIKLSEYIDELEFPWSSKYINFGVEFWRLIVLESIKHGFKLRPMMEFGLQTPIEIERDVEFLNKIGIRTIMTSSGLVSEITTIEKWQDVKDLIPRIFEVKVGGIITLDDVKKFMDSDIDLAATTMDITYDNKLGNDGDYFGDEEEWSLPTNF